MSTLLPTHKIRIPVPKDIRSRFMKGTDDHKIMKRSIVEETTTEQPPIFVVDDVKIEKIPDPNFPEAKKGMRSKVLIGK